MREKINIENQQVKGKIMKKSLVLIGTVAIGLESVFMGSTVIHAENNEKISERFLNEKITVLSEYNAENQTDVVLLENGELWQVYPKVEKMMDGVKAAEAEWFSNSEQRVWILKTDGTLLEETVQGETEVDENVKEIIDSNSRIYLKEDGTVYEREKEDGIKCSVITDGASQIFSWGFVKTDGSIGDYYDGCIIPAEQVEYVSDVGFYVKNDGFYTRLQVGAGLCISDKSSFVNVGDYKLKEISSAKEYYTYRLGVTEDQKVYAFDEQWDSDNKNSYVEATFCGGNPKDISPSYWMSSDIDWIDQNGYFYKKADRRAASRENPLTLTYLSYGRSSYDTSIYLQAVAENQGYVMLKDGTEILDNVVDMTGNIVQNKKSVLAIRMDGKVYEMTDTLTELGTIGGTEDKTVKGDVTGDNRVDIQDLRAVLRVVCDKETLDETKELAADVTGDGKVDIQDLRMILRYVCGKIDTLELG